MKIKQTIATALLLGSLVATLPACSSPQREQRMLTADLNRARAALLQAGDADSLAAAAVLTNYPHGDAEVRLALLSRAVALAPERTDLR